MTPQEKEKKLREAAEKLIKSNLNHENGSGLRASVEYYATNGTPTGGLFLSIREIMVLIAKSEAAREYHQQEPKEVDVLELARNIWSLIPRQCDSNIEAMEVAKRIIEELKPNLQPKQKSDAVEFVTKLLNEGYLQFDDDGNAANITDHYIEFEKSKIQEGGSNAS